MVSQEKVSGNQVIRSRVAQTQQPDAERLFQGVFNASKQILIKKITKKENVSIEKREINVLSC